MKYIRFADLKDRRIVASWAQLRNLINKYEFPAGRMLGPNTRAWTEDEVQGWLDSRPTAPKRAPIVHGRRGRPRKAERLRAEASGRQIEPLSTTPTTPP
jgi:hypothetical protein